MSEFINTIDLLGDEVVTDAIIQKTFEGEFADNVMTSLGDSAFRGCELITKINVPNVTGKLTGSFYGCTNLVKVNLPKVETIGGNVIDCSSIASICLPSCKSILDWGLRNSKLLEADLPVCTSIGKYAFYQANNMHTLILRSTEKCTFVGGSLAVYIDDKVLPITKIYVPRALVDSYKADEFLTDFVDRIFALEDYTLSGTLSGAVATEDMTEIYDDVVVKITATYRFSNYTNLVSIDLPELHGLAAYGCKGCTSLKEVHLPKLVNFGAGLFYDCTSLETIDLPLVETLGSSEDGGFSGCTLLKNVNLPKATYIKKNSFYGCTSLETISLPSATEIGNGTLNGCTSLKNVNLPEATTVGVNAFFNCTSLKTLDLPKVGSIGAYCFNNCTSLTALILRSTTLCTSGGRTNQNTPLESGTGYIYVPRALVEEYKVATNWTTVASQFRALEDYTVDGTITGELDESKI